MLPSGFSDQFIKETLKNSPVRALRSPFSINEAAARVGIYRNSLYLYEVGVYSEPPHEFFHEFKPPNMEFPEFQKLYYQYRHYKRRLFLDQTSSDYMKQCLDSSKASNHNSPIQSLIDQLGISTIAFCKILCINPGQMNSILRGKKKALSLEIENCFIELGLDFADCDELNERQKEFCGVT